MKPWLVVLFVIVVVGVVGGAGYLGYQSNHPDETPVAAPPTVAVTRGEVVQSVTAPGVLVDAGELTLQSRVSGQVESLSIRPGDRVKAGQTLAWIGDRRRFEAALADAHMKMIEAQAALATQQSGLPLAEAKLALTEAQKEYDKAHQQRESKQYARASQETIDIARANYVIAEEGASDAEARYDQVDDRPEDDPLRAELFSQWAAARQQRDKALANLNYMLSKPNEQEIAEADARLALAQARLEEAQRKLDGILKDGGPDLALAAARLRNAEIALADAEADLESLEIKAPFDGIVTEVNARAGQSVAAGAALVSLTDPTRLEAQVTVVEEDLPLVKVGQAAELYFDAIPDVNVAGRIARVVPKRAAGDRALYTVYITLDHVPEQLASGMTVDASIVINNRAGVLRLPRALVRARSDGSAEVQVWINGRIEARKVMVGLRGDSFVEIASGLQEGDQVVSR